MQVWNTGLFWGLEDLALEMLPPVTGYGTFTHQYRPCPVEARYEYTAMFLSLYNQVSSQKLNPVLKAKDIMFTLYLGWPMGRNS